MWIRAVALLLVMALYAPPAQSYDLGGDNCGGEYRVIWLEFPENVTSFEDIEPKLLKIPFIKTKYINQDNYLDKDNNGITDLYSEIKAIFEEERAPDWKNDITVPIGSEEFVAETLTSAGIISRAENGHFACGGVEVNYILIDKKGSSVNLRDFGAFAAFFSDKVAAYASSGSKKGSVSDGRLIVSPIEPFFPTK